MRLTHYHHPFARNFGFAPFLERASAGDFDTQVERLLGSVFDGAGACGSDNFFPVDLYEDKENTYIRAELPGVARSDINIEVVDGRLEISAMRKTGSGDNAQTASLKRSVMLPENTQADKISAATENGVLTVTLPKQPQAAPRKITISVN